MPSNKSKHDASIAEQHRYDDHSYFANPRAEMLNFIPTWTHAALDIGCGNGLFGASIQAKYGAEVWGVELTSAAVAAGKILHKVFRGPIQDHIDALPNSYFDCICLNDVIEHLVDPWTVLRQLREKLTAHGMVVASIPNIRHYKNLWQLLIEGSWTYTDEGVLDRTHLRFYTPRSMQELFADCGYRVTQLEGLRGSKKFKVKIWSYISLGKLRDIAYPQFAVVAAST